MESRYEKSEDVPFEHLARFFERCSMSKTSNWKKKELAKFRRDYVPRQSDDIFEIYRLLCPDVSRRCAFLHRAIILASVLNPRRTPTKHIEMFR